MGILLGLVTYFGWGLGDVFGAFASRKVGSFLATVYVFIFGFIVATLYVPFALSEVSRFVWWLVLLNIGIGSLLMMGNFMLNEAFRTANASVVGVVVQSFPAVVLILSAVIFKDTITPRQMLWTVLVFAGVFLCTVELSDLRQGKVFAEKGVRLALVASLIFSIYFTFLRVFADTYGWFWSNYLSIASFPISILLYRTIFEVKEKFVLLKQPKIILATLASGVLLRGADIALNVGVAAGLAATVTPLASASPTLFLAVSAYLFKDPISKQQKLGIAVTILGIILLSFFA